LDLKMKLKKIINLWFKLYGENMKKEYPGFYKELKKLLNEK